MELTIGEILDVTGGRTLQPGRKNSVFNVNISGISTDSRKLKRGELFVALKGKRFDGDDFVTDALKKGAIGAIVSEQNSKLRKLLENLQLTTYNFIIQVPDTLKALGDIAQYWRRKFKIPLIAITGSCGKTTTREIISSMLSSKFKVLKSPHNFNNLIGLPLTIFNLALHDEVAVVEVGMSVSGEIKRLTEIAQPQIAVITNVGKAHMEFFDSLEDIAEAKAELLQTCSNLSVSVLNRDDEFFPYLLSKTEAKVITFGMHKESDFWAERITFDSLGRATFYLNGEKKVKLPFPGRGNIYNVLASLATVSVMGMKIEEAVSSINHVVLPSGRNDFYRMNGIYILDDTYNANPSSLLNLLETVERIKVRNKKILVLGDMLQLGRIADEEHKKIGKLISDSSVDVLLTIGKKAELTAKAISKNKRVWHFKDTVAAKDKLEALLEKGDLLAIKGSRMTGMERLLPGECREEALLNRA
ncbi:MAG TPA: UDP-N-acetylmuramoyl-tripeptide--D-alanyl-D-alanine ligase [Candidatus Omnitrophica bacterium]|nr:UDP-N-acetylmuramoyl-tripeptide--D-alanyl-D-alanine ligase [Candidatus Omnitrophota bacterium]